MAGRPGPMGRIRAPRVPRMAGGAGSIIVVEAESPHASAQLPVMGGRCLALCGNLGLALEIGRFGLLEYIDNVLGLGARQGGARRRGEDLYSRCSQSCRIC